MENCKPRCSWRKEAYSLRVNVHDRATQDGGGLKVVKGDDFKGARERAGGQHIYPLKGALTVRGVGKDSNV